MIYKPNLLAGVEEASHKGFYCSSMTTLSFYLIVWTNLVITQRISRLIVLKLKVFKEKLKVPTL